MATNNPPGAAFNSSFLLQQPFVTDWQTTGGHELAHFPRIAQKPPASQAAGRPHGPWHLTLENDALMRAFKSSQYAKKKQYRSAPSRRCRGCGYHLNALPGQ
eukprot:6190336-Pleurochrysis_carterae.AAC.1